MSASEIQVLLDLLDEGYDRESWHGANLRQSINRVKLDEATWRPSDAYHNVWEIVIHAAYWKYVVWRRLTGEKRGGFPRKGSDWFVRPSGEAGESWTEDVKLLEEIHQKLRLAVVGLDSSELPLAPGESTVTNAAIIRGVAFHDVYHAGQIQTVRTLYKQR
jgi:hypothetical protein